MTQTQASALRAVLAPVSAPAAAAAAAGGGGGGGGGAVGVNEALLPLVLKELSRYASLGCNPPPPPAADPEAAARAGNRVRKARTGACQALALAAMDELSTLYTRYCDTEVVKKGGVVEHAIATLRVPMIKKYSCPAPALWRRAVLTFVSIVHAAVSGATLHSSLSSSDAAVVTRTEAVWDAIIRTLEDALFSYVVPLLCAQRSACRALVGINNGSTAQIRSSRLSGTLLPQQPATLDASVCSFRC
jgi:hypothetical protein